MWLCKVCIAPIQAYTYTACTKPEQLLPTTDGQQLYCFGSSSLLSVLAFVAASISKMKPNTLHNQTEDRHNHFTKKL